MIIKTFGDKYHKFFRKTLKKYNYIKHQDGFNMSLLRLEKNKYLFCIRVLGIIPVYFGEEVIPGNNANLKFKLDIYRKDKISYGKNFFWNNWNRFLIDNSIFFVGYLDDETFDFKIDKKIKPFVVSNYSINIPNYFYSDIRLFKSRNKIFCYDGFISSIIEISIKNDEIKGGFYLAEGKVDLLFYIDICINIKKYDKNWSFIKITSHDNQPYFMFLNWFENGYLTVSYIPLNVKNKDCIKKNIIKMKGDLIDGIGNKKLPMFSFGTPMFQLNENEWIGSGHIKIINTYKYENDELNNFKIQLLELNKEYNYVEHLSYVYLTYHILLSKNNGEWKMLISDAFLYIPVEKKYVFSINFPVGIDVNNGNVIVSMGFGDYYTGIISYKLEEFKKLCIHDIQYFETNKFKFYIEKNL